jgi:hypothetical protein
MRKYCKAYHLRDLRQFAGWSETNSANLALADESIVYLWDDYTVATSPIHHTALLFQNVTPEWQNFCTQTLHFAIPDDLRYASAQQNGNGTTP